MLTLLSPSEIAALTILPRPVMLMGAGLTDAWLLFRDIPGISPLTGRSERLLVDIWVKTAA